MRAGRFGAYVNRGKVNATIPQGTTPDSITLDHALELLAEREGRPVAQPRKGAGAPAKTKAAPRESGSRDRDRRRVLNKPAAKPKTPRLEQAPVTDAAKNALQARPMAKIRDVDASVR